MNLYLLEPLTIWGMFTTTASMIYLILSNYLEVGCYYNKNKYGNFLNS